jgi:hypothetical protein
MQRFISGFFYTLSRLFIGLSPIALIGGWEGVDIAWKMAVLGSLFYLCGATAHRDTSLLPP